MDGVLTQLVASENLFESISKFSTAYNSFTFNNNNTLIIHRESDLFLPQYIIFNQTDNIQRLKSVKFRIGGELILDIDINFLKKILPDCVTEYNNTIVYNIGFNRFYQQPYSFNFDTDGFIMIALQYQNIECIIETIDEINVTSIELYGINKFLNTPNRRSAATQLRRDNILQLQSYKINNVTTNSIIFAPPFILSTTGFFIEMPVIDNLSEIKININNMTYIHLNIIQIKLYCIRITDDLIYIPINSKIDMWDASSGCILNMSRLDSLEFVIHAIDNINTIKVYTLTKNELLYNNGIATLVYESNNHHIEIDNLFERIINRKYLSDEVCQISYLPIYKKILYLKCSTCQKCFIKRHILLWLDRNNSCPNCRSAWADYTNYRNL